MFAARELEVETERQFLWDGGHFESSTYYHRLCAEMVTVCVVVLAAVPRQRIEAALMKVRPRDMRYGASLSAYGLAKLQATFTLTGQLISNACLDKIARAAAFTRDVARKDGSVPQIGDNDSGRFIRLGGWIEEGSVADCRIKYANLASFDALPDDEHYVTQTSMDHQQWLAWAAALLGDSTLLNPLARDIWSTPLALARSMVKPIVAPFARSAAANCTGVVLDEAARRARNDNGLATHTVLSEFQIDGDLFSHAQFIQYPAFGIYVVRSERLHLLIRCGRANRLGASAHAHEDQLSFDMTVDGLRTASDRGTYVYTASPHDRKAYRSAYAHHGPATTGGSYSDTPIFSAPRHAYGKCLHFSREGFVGVSSVDGGTVLRTLLFARDHIYVRDEYALCAPWRPITSNAFETAASLSYSPAYGVVVSQAVHGQQ
jgi:hypothetical protein